MKNEVNLGIKLGLTVAIAGAVAVFGGGSVIMGMIATATQPISTSVSQTAGSYAYWYGVAAVLIAALPLLAVILRRATR